MDQKTPGDSQTIMNELVLPNDTNPLHNLRGGRLLHWMDICAAISAQKHSRSICVTAAVDNVSFATSIKVGQVVTLTARVVRTFTTSMEVHIEVWSQNLQAGEKCKSNDAFYTFVALDGNGKPKKVPPIYPETVEENSLSENALLRRQLKLVMAGKLRLSQADELKSRLEKWVSEDESMGKNPFYND